jgi:hypothetical protein
MENERGDSRKTLPPPAPPKTGGEFHEKSPLLVFKEGVGGWFLPYCFF